MNNTDIKANRPVSVVVDSLEESIPKTKLMIAHNNDHLLIEYPFEKAIVLALRAGIHILTY